MRQRFCMAAAFAVFAGAVYCQTAAKAGPPPKIFGGSKIEEVYRVLLDRNALLLESIMDVIKQKNIQDGEVIVSSGSVQECTYHYVSTTDPDAKNVYKTVKGPFEILNATGVIASGEPHIHITLSGPQTGAFGEHLENGCKILYLAEITLMKYSGPALTRKNNEHKISMLQAK